MKCKFEVVPIQKYILPCTVLHSDSHPCLLLKHGTTICFCHSGYCLMQINSVAVSLLKSFSFQVSDFFFFFFFCMEHFDNAISYARRSMFKWMHQWLNDKFYCLLSEFLLITFWMAKQQSNSISGSLRFYLFFAFFPLDIWSTAC